MILSRTPSCSCKSNEKKKKEKKKNINNDLGVLPSHDSCEIQVIAIIPQL